MSVGLYSHTTRGTGTVLTAAIYNSDHENHITNHNPSMMGAYSDNVAQMQVVTDPGGLGSEDLAESLAGELERIRFAIARITGEAQWYIDPGVSIADLSAGLFEELSVTNELTPAEITANQNNYAPTGHADAFHFRLSSDASRNITGLAGGAIGRIVCITNIGANAILLLDEDGNSTDINRFAIGDQGAVSLFADESVLLRYDITTDRWRPMQSAVPPAGSVSFSNAVSGLAATNVQEAIDEVEDRVDDLEATVGLELLASGTIDDDATLDIPLTAYTAYRVIEIVLTGILPANDDVEFWCRLSSDGGSNFDSSGYSFTSTWSADDNTANFGNLLSASAAQILLAGHTTALYGVSNVANEGGVDAVVRLHGRTTARFTRVESTAGYFASIGAGGRNLVSGLREAAQDTDAIQFLFQTGNITSGSWAVYGYK